MKLIIKTMKQEQFQVEVEPTTTTLQLKQQIKEQKQFEVESQKLIHKGKPMVDEKTMEEQEVKDGEFLKTQVQKPPAQQPPQSVPVQQKPTEQQVPEVEKSEPETQTQQQNAPQKVQSESDLVMGEQFNKTIEEFINMGFTREQSTSALRAAFNNPERAIDYLINGIPANILGTQTHSQPESQPARGQMNAQSLQALLSNPALQSLRNSVQQNPQLIGPIMQQLAQSQPQLYQLIQQNQSVLSQFLLGGNGDGGDDGEFEEEEAAEQMVPPGILTVTPEEKADIDNIIAMGFHRQDAIEAYITCDRNIDTALCYLMDRQARGDLLCNFIISYKKATFQEKEEEEIAKQESLQGNQNKNNNNPPPKKDGDDDMYS